MDFERILITQVIRRNLAREILDRRILPEYFSDNNDNKPVFEYIISFYNQYKTTPNEDVIKSKFPEYEFETSDTPLEFLCDNLTDRNRFNTIQDIMRKVAKSQSEKDTKKSEELIRDLYIKLSSSYKKGSDKNWCSPESIDDRIARYFKIKENGGLVGIPTPFEGLNRATGGLCKEDFWLYTARMGVGKSWQELFLASCLFNSMYRPLIFSPEMSYEDVSERLDAMHSKVPFYKLRMGSLNEEQELLWLERMEELKYNSTNREFWVVGTDEGTTLSSIDSKIDKYNPDVVLIDGLQHIKDQLKGKGENERLTNISHGVKGIAKDRKIPIIGTSHLNRDAEDLDANLRHIRMSDQLGADASVIVMFFQDDMMRDSQPQEVKAVLKKVRQGAPGIKWESIIKLDFDKMEIYEEEISDIFIAGVKR